MKKPVKRSGKHALAAAIRAFTEEHRSLRRVVALHELKVAKLAEVAACIANELAAASMANVAELTALRQAVERLAPADDEPVPRRIGRT